MKGFISTVENPVRQKDAFVVLAMMEKITGEKPKMWGTSIIGFGSYHYKSKSGCVGDWPLIGFSPRKQNLALYIMPGFKKYQDLLKKLGKYKTSVSCLYLNKLADIDTDILKEIIHDSVQEMKKQYHTTNKK